MPKAKETNSYNAEEINFIYKILIDRRQEIKNEIKTIGDRSTLLFGIFVAILSALASVALKDFGVAQELSNFDAQSRIVGTIIFFSYAIMMFIRIRSLISPNFSDHIYDDIEDIYKQNIKNIRIYEFEKLQNEVKSYAKILKERSLYFKNFTFYLTLSPFIASAWVVYFWYVA